MIDWQVVPVFGEPKSPATVRPSAYAIVRADDGRIAVVDSPNGCYLPGGGQDAGETAEATVIRESAEECALVIEVGRWRAAAIDHMWSVTELTQFEKRSSFCDATVVATGNGTGEADHELRWLTAAEAIDSLGPPSHRWAVAEWRSSRR